MARQGRGRYVAILVLAVLVAAVVPQGASAQTHSDQFTEAGDAFQIILPAGALAATVVLGDWEGTKQFVLGGTANLAAVHGVKRLWGKERPDESGHNSFPSGHTAAAFYCPAFIHRRYGWKWAAPLYLGAMYVGYSRLHANVHWGDDVVAGASLSLLANWIATTPYKGRVAVVPDVRSDGYELAVRVTW